MMKQTDKPPTLVHRCVQILSHACLQYVASSPTRWDWHFWHFLVSLIPAGTAYLMFEYIVRPRMVEDARKQGYDVTTYAELQAAMPQHQSTLNEASQDWLQKQKLNQVHWKAKGGVASKCMTLIDCHSILYKQMEAEIALLQDKVQQLVAASTSLPKETAVTTKSQGSRDTDGVERFQDSSTTKDEASRGLGSQLAALQHRISKSVVSKFTNNAEKNDDDS